MFFKQNDRVMVLACFVFSLLCLNKILKYFAERHDRLPRGGGAEEAQPIGCAFFRVKHRKHCS